MAVCPVCEHEQREGSECEVCGKPLAGAAGAPAAMPRLLELEPTLLDYVAGPAPEPVEGLEPNARGVQEFSGQVEPPAWLERTGHEASPEVPVEAMEVERLAPAELPEQDPGPQRPRCRYCQTEWSPGQAFCQRCGMRLPAVRAQEGGEPEPSRCSQCGGPARGEVCPGCGARLQAEEG